MKKVRKILLTVFVETVVMTLLLVVLFETGICEDGLLAAADGGKLEFIVLTGMELLTLALIPTALRLFKFKKIEADLKERHEVALQKWGVLRLSMLDVPLVFNTLGYYLFLNTSFGYLAIIVLLCLFLVWPTEQRCRQEAFVEVDAS